MGKIMRGLRNLFGWLGTRRERDTPVAMHREKAEEGEGEKNEKIGSEPKAAEQEKSDEVQVIIEEGNGQDVIAGTVEMEESGDPFEGITFDDLISEDEAEEEVNEGGNGGEADVSWESEEMLESPEVTEKTVTGDGNAEQQAGIDEMEIENEVGPFVLVVEKGDLARESQKSEQNDDVAMVTSYPFTCQHCHRTFGCKSLLKMHFEVHSTDRNFQCLCHICGKGLTNQSSLAAHLKTHLAQRPRPYGCQQCSRRFFRKPDLVHHLVVHTDERPFKSPLSCHWAFRWKHNLKQHLMKYHKISKEEANQLTNQVNSVDMSSVIQSNVPGEPSTRKDQGTQTENNN